MNRFLFVALASLLLCGLTACGESDSSGSGQGATSGHLTITSPVNFEGDATLISSGVVAEVVEGVSILSLSGQIQTGSTPYEVTEVGLFMPAEIEPGAYLLKFDLTNPEHQTSAAFSRPAPDSPGEEDFAFSKSGTLTILKHDKDARYIEGTFNFQTGPFSVTQGQGVVVNDGSFSLNYVLASEY